MILLQGISVVELQTFGFSAPNLLVATDLNTFNLTQGESFDSSLLISYADLAGNLVRDQLIEWSFATQQPSDGSW